jgi:hypothetical protein
VANCERGAAMEREEEVGRKVTPPRPPCELVLRNTCKRHSILTKQINILQNLTSSSSVADPDPGSGALLTPGSGVSKKNQDPDPG